MDSCKQRDSNLSMFHEALNYGVKEQQWDQLRISHTPFLLIISQSFLWEKADKYTGRWRFG